MRMYKAQAYKKSFVPGLLLVMVALFSTASYSQSYEISIRPPTTLTIDGQSITQGIFNLAGGNGIFRPGRRTHQPDHPGPR